MRTHTLTYSATNRSSDHNFTLLVTFLLTLANVIYTGYLSGHTEGVRQSGGMLHDLPYTLEGLHIVMSFFLAASVAGLWLRRPAGLIISFLGLVGVLAIYGHWYMRTLGFLSELQTNLALYRRVEQEVGPFLGATKWDFAVLAITLVLFVWHVPQIVRLRRTGT